jgi:hypothetical protein
MIISIGSISYRISRPRKEIDKLKKVIFTITCLFTIVFSMSVHATDPGMNETDQWSIKVEHSSNQKTNIILKNKGKKVYTVVAKVKSPEASKISKKSVNRNGVLKFEDVKMELDSEQIEVMISWREKLITSRHGKIASGQTHKETIVISP